MENAGDRLDRKTYMEQNPKGNWEITWSSVSICGKDGWMDV